MALPRNAELFFKILTEITQFKVINSEWVFDKLGIDDEATRSMDTFAILGVLLVAISLIVIGLRVLLNRCEIGKKLY